MTWSGCTNPQAALKFYLEGLDMKVLRSRTDAKAGTNTTFVGYGSEQLTVPKTFAPGELP